MSKAKPKYIDFGDKHFIALLAAAPRGGKTHLIKYIVYQLLVVNKRYDSILVFTASPHDYEYLPASHVITNYTDEYMKKIIDYQYKNRPNKSLLLIFDDFSGIVSNIHNNKILSAMLARHRHLECSILFAAQYVNMVSPTIREITQFYMVFKQFSEDSVRALYKCAGYNFDKWTSFKKYIDTRLGDHKFLFVDKGSDERAKICRAPEKLLDFELTFGKKKSE